MQEPFSFKSILDQMILCWIFLSLSLSLTQTHALTHTHTLFIVRQMEGDVTDGAILIADISVNATQFCLSVLLSVFISVCLSVCDFIISVSSCAK